MPVAGATTYGQGSYGNKSLFTCIHICKDRSLLSPFDPYTKTVRHTQGLGFQQTQPASSSHTTSDNVTLKPGHSFYIDFAQALAQCADGHNSHYGGGVLA